MSKEEITLDIQGMTCDSCSVHDTKARVAVPGWQSGRATLLAGPGVSDAALVEAVAAAGYRARVASRRSPSAGTGPVQPGHAEVDLLVIGAGSAGFAAAIRAAELGYSVTLVGEGTIGGTCVNVGCVPSKTLIRAAEAYHRAGHSPFGGVRPRGAGLDWAAVVEQKDALVAELRQSKYVDVLAAYPSITYVEGRARLLADGGVAVNGRTYHPARIVVATGASPHPLPIPGIEKVAVLTSTEALSLRGHPESLLVIGGRAVALELAQIYARFGTQVTILQRSPRLIPEHEAEIAEALADYLREEGVTIHTSVRVQHIRQQGSEKVVMATVGGEKREFRTAQVLMATGRWPNTADMGLQEAGIELDDRGAIRVNAQMQTTNPRVYAAGDVIGGPMLVYVAAASGTLAAENALLGTDKPLDLSTVPAVIFTDPQVATVGLTEAQARARGLAVSTAVLPLDYVARALAAHDTRGLIKLVADEESGRLLGAHVLAAEGGEVIQAAALALRAGWRVSDLRETLFPYLTQVEGLKLAALAFEKDVRKLSCCAG